MNLKDALEKNKLKDFIKERTKEEKRGDKEKFDKAIMAVNLGGCKYTSLVSRINLGYIIGCELGRPRFEPYK